jgi:glucan phosphoethanolaminetransferase (alkaline phosphatase superfamily)
VGKLVSPLAKTSESVLELLMKFKALNAGSGSRVAIGILASIILSVLLPVGVGFGVDAEQVLTVFIMLILISQVPYAPGLVLILIFPIMLYLPTGIMYGKPNAGVFASFLETNLLEAKEFLGALPIAYCLLSVALFFSALAWFFVRPDLGWWKGRVRPWVGVFCVAFLAHSAVLKFYKYTFINYFEYVESSTAFAAALSVAPSWEVAEVPGEKYELHVVVIGESVRKDYMSTYGYPHPTTPFLDSAPGYFVDGYVSAAPNTLSSLTRMLAITSEDGLAVDPAHNVVSLANAAGLETWWISNQGALGDSDIGAASIAARSQNRIFLKLGEYDTDNKDDDLLLDKLQVALESSDKRKVIFLHMMGSHFNECQRLHGYPVNFTTLHGDRFNCYLASIEKTDAFLREARLILERSGHSFSMVYFSDHGMITSREGSSEYRFKHGTEYKQNYEVPFFILASNLTEHVKERKNLSGFQFMDFFASWINVKTPLTREGYDVRTVQHDPNVRVYNYSGLAEYAQLGSQEALH